jgi:hypothetical protein
MEDENLGLADMGKVVERTKGDRGPWRDTNPVTAGTRWP